MVQLIIGQKGKGKTTAILSKVNEEIKTATGNIVFLDKDSQHMYELNNRIRLIDVSVYPISNPDEFVGFVSGIISQDHDLQQMYFDSFLKIAAVEDCEIAATIEKLEKISTQFGVDFILSVSKDEAELPESVKKNIVISL